MSEKQSQTSPSQGQKSNPAGMAAPLPLLVDFSLSLARALVVLMAALIAIVSLAAGAPLEVVLLRSGAAVLCLGWLLWLLNWLISRNALLVTLAEMREKTSKAQAEQPLSTTEKAA